MVDKGTPKSGEPERSSLLGDLANKLQEGLWATVEALKQSHAQRLAAIVESLDDAIISVDLEGGSPPAMTACKNCLATVRRR